MAIKAYVVLNPVGGQSDPEEIRALLTNAKARDQGLWDFPQRRSMRLSEMKKINWDAWHTCPLPFKSHLNQNHFM